MTPRQTNKQTPKQRLLIDKSNRLLSTIDGNVEFVHSQYSCILSSQVSIQFLCPTKLSIIINNFRIKCVSYSKISAISFVL